MTSTQRQGLRILWPTDGSESSRSAVPWLRGLLLPGAERLEVLAVAPGAMLAPARLDPALARGLTAGARRRAVERAEQVASQAAEALMPASCPVQAVARWGNPIPVVLEESRKLKADVIALGSKGHSNLALLLLGSVSQGIVQHATCSVLVCRPGREQVRKVLVGYDGSPPARKALRFLERLTLPAGCELHLVNVVEPFVMPAGMPPAYRARAMAEASAIRHQQQRHAEHTTAAAGKLLHDLGLEAKLETVDGNPADEILQRAGDADLVVVGSRKPSAARHYLLGSTAEKLVRHSKASVLVVR